MKKLLFALLFVSTAFIMADQTLVLNPRHAQGTGPLTIDELVYSQTYSFRMLQNGFSNYGAGNRWVCDDFTLDDYYYVTDIHVWMIWTGAQATQMNLVISEDDLFDSDPNTNIHIWEESVPCTNTFTGDSNWGYDIYETHCTISADVYPELEEGVHYYLETQADTYDNSNTFILLTFHYIGDECWYDDGSGIYVCNELFSDFEMFFDLYGEPVSTLEPETWGSIKTLF